MLKYCLKSGERQIHLFTDRTILKSQTEVEEKKGETGMPVRDSSSIICFRGGHVQSEVYTVQFLPKKRNTVHEVPGET
jgi:hypothetical protein